MEGHPYTWSKWLSLSEYVEERIEWAFKNPVMSATFSQIKLSNLVAPRSDHSPLLLELIHRQPTSFSVNF